MSLKISTETTFLLDMTNATQYGPEIHTTACAASDPNSNEANSTNGWSDTLLSGTGSNVFESQSAVKNVGTYSIHASANDTPSSGARFEQTFTVENGETYHITYDRRHNGTGGATDHWAGFFNGTKLDDILQTETTFSSVSFDVLATSTSMLCRFIELNSNNDGGIYLDNFSIRKVL